MNDLRQAQAELRYSYVRGGPGAVVSGLVWLAAAITAEARGVPAGFAVLFFGGMAIFPLGLLVVRGVFRRPSTSEGNPAPRVVIETVFPMIGGFLAAWLLLPHRPDVVFPLAAIAVGSHYFGFRTAYGDASYWALAAVMCGLGTAAILWRVPPPETVVWVIAGVEMAFGAWSTLRGVTRAASDAAA